MIEAGAASIIITLNEGCIEVLHGEDKTLLAKLDNAPHGTWKAIFSNLKSLGFDGMAITKERPRPNPAIFSVGPIKGERSVKNEFHGHNVHQSVIAVKGAVVFVAEKNEFFGGKQSKAYRSEVMVNPTWKQVFAAFKASIPVTLDYHHCFLEGVGPLLRGKVAQHCVVDPHGKVPYYTFCAGS